MKNCKELEPEGFYIFRSRATANSAYFEDGYDIHQFVGIIRSKFRGVMRVYDYVCGEGGWTLAVKLTDENSIRKEFMRYNAKELDQWEVWRMVSELMRYSLSQYVKGFNRRHGRSGAGVHSRYERYQFGTKRELLEYLASMRDGIQEVCQVNERYRPAEKLYDQLKRLGKVHSLLCSKNKVRDWGYLVGIWGYVIDYHVVTSDVVDNWLRLYQRSKIFHHPT